MKPRTKIVLPQDGFNALADCRAGPMLYNRNDQYVGASLRKYGEFSPGETELFRQIVQPGWTVVEAGANIGAHTVDLSRLVGRDGVVLAFEPQRLVFQTLCANLALNSCANVHALRAGIGAVAGEITTPFVAPNQPFNFGGVSLVGVTEGERAPLRTIDELGLAACHFIKLDIEGMEVEALKGAESTIRACRPMMYVENDREQRSEELLSLLLARNYRPYWHVTPLFSPDNYAGDGENIFGNIHSFNVLCVPRERNIVVEKMKEITSPTTGYEAR